MYEYKKAKIDSYPDSSLSFAYMESKLSHRQTQQTIKIVGYPLPILKTSFPISKISQLSRYIFLIKR